MGLDEPGPGLAVTPDVRFLLEDMREFAQKAVRILGDASDADLASDEILSMAVIHVVQIVGEAASKVPPEARRALPELPWKGAIATRNVIVHGYRKARLDVVADTVRQDFPRLIADLERLLGEQDT